MSQYSSDAMTVQAIQQGCPSHGANGADGLRCAVRVAVIGVLLPFLLSLIVYYGFFTSYVGGAFHRDGFLRGYSEGVKRYRVLGRLSLPEVHRVVVSQTLPGRLIRRVLPEMPRGMKMFDVKGDKLFYGAIFLYNTFFLVGAALILYAVLYRKAATPEEQALASGRYAMGLLLMVVTQYVPTPYDNLLYFFLMAGIYLTVVPGRWSDSLLLACMVLGTLTRETMALLLVFFLAYHFDALRRLDRRTMLRFGGLTGAFLATYLTLRGCYGTEHAVWEVVRWRLNLQEGLCGLGFLLLPALCWLILAGVSRPGRCWIFLAASIPYVLAMVTIANTWETRLWVPVWLGLLVLAHLDTRAVAARAAL